MNTRTDPVTRSKPGGSIAGIPVLTRISMTYPGLTPTERKVADALLADPAAFTRMPMARIEITAGVSPPSVMRFCRAIGYAGLTDLKFALAASLTPADTALPGCSRDAPDGAAHVLDCSERIVGQLRQLLDSAQLAEAAVILKTATRIGCFASHELGLAASYARDAFLRHGLAATMSAAGTDCAPSPASDGGSAHGTVALCFCDGMPDAALFDRLGHYRVHGLDIVLLSDVPLPDFVPRTVNVVLGRNGIRGAAGALLAYCLVTDILLTNITASSRHRSGCGDMTSCCSECHSTHGGGNRHGAHPGPCREQRRDRFQTTL